MKTVLDLSNTSSTCRVLHLTDSHLFADEAGQLLGVTTKDSYEAVLTEIRQSAREYALVLATGDLVQDHALASYARFVDGVAQLKTPCAWLEGNHDDAEKMATVLNQSPMISEKIILLGEHWVIIMLNSQVAGVPYGYLPDDELMRLDQVLKRYSHRHALIALHHHPVLSQCQWLDAHQLKNAAAFSNVLLSHQNVKILLCGHIHQELDQAFGGGRLLSTPSTCVQFKPQSQDFALDQRQPAWRELLLHDDGQVETDVYYLSGDRFKPDTTSKGY